MTGQQGTVIHIATDEVSGWQMALRNLQNLVRDHSVSTPPEEMTVVVNGPAVRFLLAGSPDAFKITKMVAAGVTVCVCSNSLERFDHDPEEIAEGTTVVQSGVAEVVRAQKQGNHYLKLPLKGQLFKNARSDWRRPSRFLACCSAVGWPTRR